MASSKAKITNHLVQDPILKPLIESIPFPKLQKKDSPLAHVLIESIAYQQLSIKAAATIFGRLLDKMENREIDLTKLTRMKTETLRGVGLSYQKADYIQAIARFFLNPENQATNWDAMDEEELVKSLTIIKGVGVWTVQMIMISAMAKKDVFPALDLGVQQGIKKLYGLELTGKALHQKMNEIAEPWRPYRTIACLYLWRWKDQFRK
jgi:DNA-3-methyladenine glycosylase II